MGGEKELSLSLFRNDTQNFPQKIFKNTGIQLVNSDRDRALIVYHNQELENGNDLFDTVRFAPERDFLSVPDRNQLDTGTGLVIIHKLCP